MKVFERLDNYINDKEYKIIVFNNQVNIINYSEIVNFNSYQIDIRYNNKITNVIGTNLVISKMMEEEILITGNIKEIKFT